MSTASLIFEKHIKSNEACGLLNANDYYNSSVHCAYFSVIQLLKHIWLYKSFKSENSLKGVDTHVILFNNAQVEMNNNLNDRMYIENKFASLKKLRKSSDYGDCRTIENDAKESLQLSVELCRLIKSKVAI